MLAKSGKNYIEDCSKCPICSHSPKRYIKETVINNESKNDLEDKNYTNSVNLKSSKIIEDDYRLYSEPNTPQSKLSFSFDVCPPTPPHNKKDYFKTHKRPYYSPIDQLRATIAFMLVDAGVDINGFDGERFRPLHHAAKRGLLYFLIC